MKTCNKTAPFNHKNLNNSVLCFGLLCFPQHMCLNVFTHLWKHLEKCLCCLIPHINGNFMAVLEINILKLENILWLFPLQKQIFKTQSNILPVIWKLITFLWKMRIHIWLWCCHFILVLLSFTLNLYNMLW